VNRLRRFLSFSWILFFAIAGLALASCAHKAIAPDSASGSNALSSEVTDQPIASDPQGSDGGKIDGLASVHFEYDQANLTPDTRKSLALNAKWLDEHKSANLLIEGHCDQHGSIEYNLALGERRAKRVQKYLTDLGISSERISVISYGKEKMLDLGDSPQADAKNRRANFVPSVSTGRKASR
jgi:peptidoglycan-associated lipoprotein